MKKYFFAFFAAAFLFSGCKNNNAVRNHVYTDNMPSLTSVPWETTVIIDTYSEYMATLTEPSDADTDTYSNTHNVLMDTAAAFGGRPEGQRITAPPRDTAAVTQPRVSSESETYTETATVNIFGDDENTETSESSQTSVSEAAPNEEIVTPPKVTGITVPPVERPPADTKYKPDVPADTRFKPTTSNTNNSSGGTDNADQYTE